MTIPIVLTAFGTTTNAMETYRFMDAFFRKRFPSHQIIWAGSSRMVKSGLKKRGKHALKHPHEVLRELSEQGHSWAVVQSLHILWGHEFQRLVEAVKTVDIRTSIGLPLLTEPQDYTDVLDAFHPILSSDPNQADILVGHGTDHPSWTSYMTLEYLMKQKLGNNRFVGVIEGIPSKEQVLWAVKQAGYQTVRMIPFMLVAGTHFLEDLAGNHDSWKAAFETNGIGISLETRGIGYLEGVLDIFARHIREALDVIPANGVDPNLGDGQNPSGHPSCRSVTVCDGPCGAI